MKRLPQLDGVRGVAILLVLVWHYVRSGATPDPHTAQWLVLSLLNLAWSGVDLFFVLSGFLIAGILIDNRDAANYFRVFYWRRVCRILPLYCAMLGIFVLITAVHAFPAAPFRWLFRDPLPLWSYATFTQNILMGMQGNYGAGWLGVTWSLAIEEQFYLVIPLLIFLFPRAVVLSLLAVIIALAVLLRLEWPGFQSAVSTLWRADSLASGCVLAYLVRHPGFVALVERKKMLVGVIFAELFAGVLVMTFRRPAFEPFDHSWLAVFYASLILVAVVYADGTLSRVLRWRVLVWFGAVSYGIYMIHIPVYGMLHAAFDGSATLPAVAVTVLAFVTTLVVAAVSHRFLERPIIALGHRVRFAVPAAR